MSWTSSILSSSQMETVKTKLINSIIFLIPQLTGDPRPTKMRNIALIDKQWFDKFCNWIRSTRSSTGISFPGPISNEELYNRLNVRKNETSAISPIENSDGNIEEDNEAEETEKDQLEIPKEGVDFEVVEENVFEVLMRTFKGGPLILRPYMTNPITNESYVLLNPLKLTVYADGNQYVRTVDPQWTVSGLNIFLCDKFQLDSSQTKLRNYDSNEILNSDMKLIDIANNLDKKVFFDIPINSSIQRNDSTNSFNVSRKRNNSIVSKSMAGQDSHNIGLTDSTGQFDRPTLSRNRSSSTKKILISSSLPDQDLMFASTSFQPGKSFHNVVLSVINTFFFAFARNQYVFELFQQPINHHLNNPIPPPLPGKMKMTRAKRLKLRRTQAVRKSLDFSVVEPLSPAHFLINYINESNNKSIMSAPPSQFYASISNAMNDQELFTVKGFEPDVIINKIFSCVDNFIPQPFKIEPLTQIEITKTITCSKCGKVTTWKEAKSCIQLEIPSKSHLFRKTSILDCLNEYLSNISTENTPSESDDPQPPQPKLCPNCSKKCKKEKVEITKLSDLLILSINRFHQSKTNKSDIEKKLTDIAYFSKIQMDKYTGNSSDQYELVSVISQSGKSINQKCKLFLYNPDQDSWTFFFENIAKPATSKSAIMTCSTLMMIYQRKR